MQQKKDLDNNILIAVQGHNHPMLFKSDLQAIKLDWVAGQAPSDKFSCKAKVRYRQPDQLCDVVVNDDESVSVHFAQLQRAITPGQSVVFYDGDVCLGGGVIV